MMRWPALSVSVVTAVAVVVGFGCATDAPPERSDASFTTDGGSCSTPDDCPVGQRCTDGRCVPSEGCQSDEDCPSGEQCRQGGCYPSSPPADTGTRRDSEADPDSETDPDSDDEVDGDDAGETPEFVHCSLEEYHDGARTSGEPYEKTTFTYRSDLQLKTEKAVFSMYPSLDYLETRSYDQQDRLVRVETDRERDGSVDKRKSLSYDDQGRLDVVNIDRMGNGSDVRREHFYNAEDQRIRTEFDTTGDGEPNRIEQYSYNSEGYLTVEGRDFGADGTIDHRYLYDYDDQGRRIEFRKDTGNDRTIDYVQHWTFENGVLAEMWVDEDGDGSKEEVTTYSYDDQGRLVEETRSDGAGGLERKKTYKHSVDAKRREERIEIDRDGDGLVDRVVLNVYSRECIDRGY